jgi:uncharacterized protein YjbJ (UPF0337 family)
LSERASEGRPQGLKAKIPAAGGNIADDDYHKAQGEREQLIGTIMQKTGEAEEAIRSGLN